VRLIQFADQAYQLSDGAFDITSGILRKIWTFDGGNCLPSQDSVEQLLEYIGWHKVYWEEPYLMLSKSMEIDLGGIGKEYAVDRCALLVGSEIDSPFLINFGGDLFSNKPPENKPHWSVGVEQVGGKSNAIIQLTRGGLATSGDANRYILHDNVRYSHILNPKTGWPVINAPRSVSVVASSCIEAGMLATMAMLKGESAETFMMAQDVPYWIQR